MIINITFDLKVQQLMRSRPKGIYVAMIKRRDDTFKIKHEDIQALQQGMIMANKIINLHLSVVPKG